MYLAGMDFLKFAEGARSKVKQPPRLACWRLLRGLVLESMDESAVQRPRDITGAIDIEAASNDPAVTGGRRQQWPRISGKVQQGVFLHETAFPHALTAHVFMSR